MKIRAQKSCANEDYITLKKTTKQTKHVVLWNFKLPKMI
jgi:hypothetical protein